MSAIDGSAFLVGLVTVYGLVPASTLSTITFIVSLVTELRSIVVCTRESLGDEVRPYVLL